MLDWLQQLIRNPFLITGLSSWFVAQVLKTILYAIIHKKIQWERLIGDGGMPSGHSATVTSIATICMLGFGPGSFEFAISAILAVIVCHDAMGVRRETGKQSVVINEILDSFDALTKEQFSEVQLKEFVGHTPVQVMAGMLIGILNALFLYFVIYK